jgi:CPA2 family monovalent cation:H+ antiporter-2
MGLAAVKLAAMMGLTFLVGERLIPWLLDRVAATHSRELFTLTVLVLALGIAVGSAQLFGVSMALGAFLAGMVVGRSEFSLRAATDALPMRDAFAVLFFVSIGILFHPRHLMESPGMVAATLGVILLGRPLASLAIILLMNYPLPMAVSVAIVTAQIGEFSFILATTGKNLGLFDDRVINTLIPAAIISITLNPVLYRLTKPIESVLRRLSKTPLPADLGEGVPCADGEGHAGRAVLVGYGPVGRTLARLLRENRIEPLVVELNIETVRQLNAKGIRAVYGDASHRETLERAELGDAVVLVLSSASMQGGGETIRLAREMNAKLLIFARSNYLRESRELRQAGADLVFSGEGEVALSMTESLLRRLGATGEQLDRERARIRSDLFPGMPDPDASTDDGTRLDASQNRLSPGAERH